MRTLSLPSALLDFGNAHAQPFSYIRGRLLILAHTQSHLLKTCASLEIESNHIHPQKFVLQSCTRVYLRSISVSSRFPFTSHSLPLFLSLPLSLARYLPRILAILIHTYIHTYLYIQKQRGTYRDLRDVHESCRPQRLASDQEHGESTRRQSGFVTSGITTGFSAASASP